MDHIFHILPLQRKCLGSTGAWTEPWTWNKIEKKKKKVFSSSR